MALIDIAADFGCSMAGVAKKIPIQEMPFWLARYMIKLGYTYDQATIRKNRAENFLQRARANNWGR